MRRTKFEGEWWMAERVLTGRGRASSVGGARLRREGVDEASGSQWLYGVLCSTREAERSAARAREWEWRNEK